jgi:hypothetical protein
VGLHIYSGSLVRFFCNDWENEIQQMVRDPDFRRAMLDRGYRFNEVQVAYPDGEPVWPTPEAAAAHVTRMRERIVSTIAVPADLSWNDNVGDYRTHKLHGEGLEAIVIVAAHLHRRELPMPEQMPVRLQDDPAYAEAEAKGYFFGGVAVLSSALIVPGTFDGFVVVDDPLGAKRLTTSTKCLRGALEDLKRVYWGGHVDPLAWRERGLSFARNSGMSEKVDGTLATKWDPEPEHSLRGNAEYAFGVFTSMLEFAEQNHAAIVHAW